MDFVSVNVSRLLSMPSVYPGVFSNLLSQPQNEVCLEEIRLSLICPLTLKKIQDLPVRGKECSHFNCFDGKSFLMKLSASPFPFPLPCPICLKNIRAQDLVKCGFTLGVLRSEKLTQNANHILLKNDLSWRPDESEKHHPMLDVSAPTGHPRMGSQSQSCVENSNAIPLDPFSRVKNEGISILQPEEPLKEKGNLQTFHLKQSTKKSHRIHPYQRPPRSTRAGKSLWEESQDFLNANRGAEKLSDANEDFYDEFATAGWCSGQEFFPKSGTIFAWSKELCTLLG